MVTTIDELSHGARTSTGVSGVSLDVVLGPMKSGKSLALISMLSPLQFTRVRHRVYQSERHVRDSGVTSRSGGVLATTKVASLHAALEEQLDVVAVDEVHMFDLDDIAVIGRCCVVAPASSWPASTSTTVVSSSPRCGPCSSSAPTP